MPDSKTKGIMLLGSATVDLRVAASTTIFTVPPNKTARVTHIVARDASTAVLAANDVKFGTGFRNNANVDMTLLATALTGYLILGNIANATTNDVQSIEVAAGANFQITVTTIATTNPTNVTFDVFGYLT